MLRKRSLAVGALALIGGGWSVLWFTAADQATRRIDGFFASEKAKGRTWTCPARHVAGFPFAITVSCDRPELTGLLLDQEARATLGALSVRAGLPDPRRLSVTLEAPLVYKTADALTDVTIGWSHLDADLLVTGARTVSMRARDVAIHGLVEPWGAQNGAAQGVAMSLAPVEGPAPPTVDFAIALTGTDIGLIDDIMGAPGAADLAFEGQLSRAVFQDATSAPVLMERWRQAGGQIDFSAVRIARAPTSLQASGPLRLDPAHRPEGNFETTFKGAEPILRHYGINANLAAAGTLLNKLFGRHRDGDASKPQDPNAITLPIRLKDGHVAIGPIQLPVDVPTLY